MATVFRAPIFAPLFHAARNVAVFAAATAVCSSGLALNPPPCPTTLDPNYTGSGITLSNDNLTASCSLPGGDIDYRLSRTTRTRTGKYVFKVTVNGSSPGNTGFGIATAARTDFGPTAEWLGFTLRGAGYYVEGDLWFNNVKVGSGDPIPIGSSALFAFDTSAQLVWIKLLPSGNWNANPAADPATGTGGFSVAGLLGNDVFGIANVGHTVTFQSLTFDFNPKEVMPSGFSAWCPPKSFLQTEWPNPRGPARSIDLLTCTENLQQTPFTVAVVTTPFAQRDWPTPPRTPPARQAETSGFDTPIRLFADGLNVPNQRQRDWPNPVRSIYRQQDLTTWVQNLLQTTLGPPFVQRDWPVPRGPAYWRQADTSGFDTPIRDFAVGLNVPNQRQIDWPNPRSPQRATSLLTWTQPKTFDPPFAETDWPNPRGPVRSIDLLTWTLQNLQQSTLAPSAVPFFETDWPNPRAPSRSIDALTWTLQNLQQSTLAPAAAAPFFETDWPVTRPLPRALQETTQGFSAPIRDFAVGLNVPNQRQRDWPNPRGPQRSVDLLTWTQDLAIFNFAVGLNTAAKPQFDWPNPRGPQRSVDLLTWTQSLVAGYTAAAVKPFLQTDWPLSVPRAYRQIAETRGFEQPILSFAVGLNDANKRKSDWPNPRGPQRASDLATWVQEGLARLTAASAVKPFGQSDWPLAIPRIYRQIAETLGFTTPIRGYAVGLNDANKRKYDWPNPSGKPPLNVGFGQGFRQTIRDAQVPFAHQRLYRWPVPIGRPPLNVGWTQGLTEPARFSSIPFANLRNYDWPVPRGPKRSIDALTWTIHLQQYQLQPSGTVAVCAHVDILFPTASVEVIFGSAELEALAYATTMDVLVSNSDVDVLVPTAETTIAECPGGEVVPSPDYILQTDGTYILMVDGVTPIQGAPDEEAET